MKYSLGISNFLEEISSLSHSIFFLYFFALITEEGFLISPWYSLELCIQMSISFLSSSVWPWSDFDEIPHIQLQRRSPGKMVGGVKSCLESNPIDARDAQRAQTKPCAHQEIPQKLSQTCLWVFECLLQAQVSSGLPKGQGLWVQQTWVWHKPSWRRSPLTAP